MIETNRLLIKPLTLLELQKLASVPDDLARDLGLSPSESLTDEATLDAIVNTLLPQLEDPGNNPFFWTMWIIIEKSSLAIAGGICFHGGPDENGEVEIGYGTDEGFRNKGIMTETIAGMLKWLRDQDQIKCVMAETDLSNPSSIRVLEKNNFTETGRNGSAVFLKHLL